MCLFSIRISDDCAMSIEARKISALESDWLQIHRNREIQKDRHRMKRFYFTTTTTITTSAQIVEMAEQKARSKCRWFTHLLAFVLSFVPVLAVITRSKSIRSYHQRQQLCEKRQEAKNLTARETHPDKTKTYEFFFACFYLISLKTF